MEWRFSQCCCSLYVCQRCLQNCLEQGCLVRRYDFPSERFCDTFLRVQCSVCECDCLLRYSVILAPNQRPATNPADIFDKCNTLIFILITVINKIIFQAIQLSPSPNTESTQTYLVFIIIFFIASDVPRRNIYAIRDI